MTPNYIALCLYVADLLKKSHLQDLLSDKGNTTFALCNNRQVDQHIELTRERIVNAIIGGSEVSGITYSATKWHVSVAVNPKTNSSPPPPYRAMDQIITFMDNEDSTLINPHHDALVISLLIANCRIKRVLVNNVSSTNVLFLNALKEVKIEESNIHRCSTILVRFSGEQNFNLGDMTLPVYTGEVNLYIAFVVLDNPSAYNVILGRPWIHQMRAVPSTFNQVIRFSTKWGVKWIKGEQGVSCDCYRNTLREKHLSYSNATAITKPSQDPTQVFDSN